MSTSAITPIEYTVFSFDADTTAAELTSKLNKIGQEGWLLATAYHLHHLNSVSYVFTRQPGSTK
jgi:hypothetical protein